MIFQNPTLAKAYGNKWNPIDIKLNKFDKAQSTTPYSGSSCFERFFGIGIEKFGSFSDSSTETTSQTPGSLFKNTQSDIYGCAVGQGHVFYELVMKTESTGFATWYDSSDQEYKQKIFLLKKENSSENWQVEIGTGIKDEKKEIPQIKDKTGEWYWWFYMPKAQISGNMQELWSEWAKGINGEWANKGKFIVPAGGSYIPKFEKVKTLDNFCQEQGTIRKNREKEVDTKKLNIYCLSKPKS